MNTFLKFLVKSSIVLLPRYSVSKAIGEGLEPVGVGHAGVSVSRSVVAASWAVELKGHGMVSPDTHKGTWSS